MKPTDAELAHRFSYHSPTPRAAQLHAMVNEAILATALTLRDLVPEGRELSLALTALEDVRHRANAGIACNHDQLGPPE